MRPVHLASAVALLLVSASVMLAPVDGIATGVASGPPWPVAAAAISHFHPEHPAPAEVPSSFTDSTWCASGGVEREALLVLRSQQQDPQGRISTWSTSTHHCVAWEGVECEGGAVTKL